MKRLFFILAMVFANISFAQTVTDVDACQEGSKIIVTYSLSGNLQAPVDVVASYSKDGGYTFHKLKSVTGDLKVYPGTGKKIVWDVLNDVESFVEANVLFRVDVLAAPSGEAYYKRGLECERERKYAEAIKFYRLALQNGYKQADERIKALQLHFW